jgi:deazaflavin-dependent oxidoreductase (nitroreductase family)
LSSWNERVIAEFRERGGKVAAYENDPLLLLTTTGARTGRQHTTPLIYLADGARLVVFGTKGGAPTNPGWYYNVLAHPTARAELGTDAFDVLAEVVEGEERERLCARQRHDRPQFAEYEVSTPRRIPVVALTRA